MENYKTRGGVRGASGPESGVSQITNCFYAFCNQNDPVKRPSEPASSSPGDFIQSYKANEAWDSLQFHRVGVSVSGILDVYI